MTRQIALIISLVSFVFATEGFAVSNLLAGQGEIDQVSSACIACHNGTNGAPASYCLLQNCADLSGGHIISVVYADRAQHNRELTPADSLPAELVLYEGRITCATCHGSNPHGDQPLAMTNDGSALCRACHLK